MKKNIVWAICLIVTTETTHTSHSPVEKIKSFICQLLTERSTKDLETLEQELLHFNRLYRAQQHTTKTLIQRHENASMTHEDIFKKRYHVVTLERKWVQKNYDSDVVEEIRQAFHDYERACSERAMYTPHEIIDDIKQSEKKEKQLLQAMASVREKLAKLKNNLQTSTKKITSPCVKAEIYRK